MGWSGSLIVTGATSASIYHHLSSCRRRHGEVRRGAGEQDAIEMEGLLHRLQRAQGPARRGYFIGYKGNPLILLMVKAGLYYLGCVARNNINSTIKVNTQR